MEDVVVGLEVEVVLWVSHYHQHHASVVFIVECVVLVVVVLVRSFHGPAVGILCEPPLWRFAK